MAQPAHIRDSPSSILWTRIPGDAHVTLQRAPRNPRGRLVWGAAVAPCSGDRPARCVVFVGGFAIQPEPRSLPAPRCSSLSHLRPLPTFRCSILSCSHSSNRNNSPRDKASSAALVAPTAPDASHATLLQRPGLTSPKPSPNGREVSYRMVSLFSCCLRTRS